MPLRRSASKRSCSFAGTGALTPSFLTNRSDRRASRVDAVMMIVPKTVPNSESRPATHSPPFLSSLLAVPSLTCLSKRAGAALNSAVHTSKHIGNQRLDARLVGGILVGKAAQKQAFLLVQLDPKPSHERC